MMKCAAPHLPRIALVCTSINQLGGKDKHLRSLFRHLNGKEADVFIFACSSVSASVAQQMRDGGIPTDRLFLLSRFKKWLVLPFIFELRHLLIKKRINIAHTFQIQSDILGGVAARCAGIGCILSTMESKAIPENISYVKKIAYRIGNILVRNWISKTIVVSEGLKKELIREKLRNEARIEVIRIGLANTAHRELSFNKQTKAHPVVGSIARFSFEKALDRLVHAIAIVRKEIPDCRFLLCGEGPEEGKLRRLADELGVGDSLTIRPWASDVYSVLSELDIFVLTSDREGCPHTILESFQMKCPVIASEIEGVRDLIEDGKNGILVDTEDPKKLADKIILLCKNKTLAKRVGENGYKVLVEKFTVETEMQKTASLYRDLLAEARRKAVRTIKNIPPWRRSRGAVFIATLALRIVFFIPRLVEKMIVETSTKETEVKKILILELWGIGDLAMMSVVLRPLGDAYPKAQITLLGKDYAKQLWESGRRVHRFEIFDFPWTRFKRKYKLYAWPWREMGQCVRRLRKERYDLVLDGRGDVRNNVLSFLIGGVRRLGYGDTGGGFLLTHDLGKQDRTQHRRARWEGLLRHLGVDGDRTGFHIEIFEEARRRADELFAKFGIEPEDFVVGIHPGAAVAIRRWPIERFAEICERIQHLSQAKVILFFGPDNWGQDIQTGMPLIRIREDLSVMNAVIDRLNVLVCNDSGPMHVGDALGKRVIAIFGPGDPDKIGPSGKNSNVILKDIACRPCFDQCRYPEPYCLTGLSVDHVWNEVQKEIEKQCQLQPQ